MWFNEGSYKFMGYSDKSKTQRLKTSCQLKTIARSRSSICPVRLGNRCDNKPAQQITTCAGKKREKIAQAEERRG